MVGVYGRSSAFLVAFALAKKKEAFSPSEGWHHCFPRFVDQALTGDPLTVFGDGQQTRCFCHVDDVVTALLGLIDEPKAEGEVFNVGSSEEVTILELAERIIEAAGSTSTVNKVSYEEAFEGGGYEDMRSRVPDISRIGSLIGWKPTQSLDEIIAGVIEYERNSR